VVVVYFVCLTDDWFYDHMIKLKLNKFFSVFSFSYTAPTTLGIKQEVKQIRANVFFIQRF